MVQQDFIDDSIDNQDQLQVKLIVPVYLLHMQA